MTVSQYYVLRKRQLRGIRTSIETEGVSVLDEYYWLNMKLFFTPDEEQIYQNYQLQMAKRRRAEGRKRSVERRWLCPHISCGATMHRIRRSSMGYTEEKKKRKRISLMDSAFQLFSTQGIAKTSIEDIAKAAGVGKGTFYLYFHDKHDLHQILVQHKSEQLLQHALACSGYREQVCAADKILSIADDILLQLQENHRLLEFFNKNLSWDVFRKAVDRANESYRPVFEDIFGADRSMSEDIRVELFTILELIGSTCHSVILRSDPVDIETFRPYLHRSIRAIVNSFQAT